MKLFTSLCACFAIFILGGCAAKSYQEAPITLADIVNDVEAHGVNSKYKEQKVTITAAGRIYPSADGDPPKLELFTHHNKIHFFITDSDAKSVLDHYYSNYMQSDLAHIRGHTTYTFTLLIKDISENITAGGARFFTIRSDVPEHTAKTDIQVINTTLEQIVTGDQNYVGKTVRLQATVSLDRLNALLGIRDDVDPELIKNYSGAMTLATSNRNVTFWIIDDTAGDGLLPSNLEKYKNHQTYTFTLYIERIVKDKGQVEITTGIADD
ncbi:hypothetical protein F4054_13145 [Candidatus Poribacteria bacterium]|nr:hypothetical protein [Candidatus Poribacteria bacterium]MYK23190.1 hypothetical protein [Candidatus Poribacteria bacterium]